MPQSLGQHLVSAAEPGRHRSHRTAEGIGHLLNLIADEHLERNLRALDRTYGDRLKRLGAYAFQTSGYSKLSDWPGGGVVGVHGTNEPNLVPGRPSHGCIRMHNKDIVRLGRLMTVGTPLLVV